jgi:putative membrane protein
MRALIAGHCRLAHTRSHTSRYLMIYLTACPLVLWNSLGWWTLPASVLMAFLLLGTENIGVQVRDW